MSRHLKRTRPPTDYWFHFVSAAIRSHVSAIEMSITRWELSSATLASARHSSALAWASAGVRRLSWRSAMDARSVPRQMRTAYYQGRGQNRPLTFSKPATTGQNRPVPGGLCRDLMLWRTDHGHLAMRRSLRPCAGKSDQGLLFFFGVGVVRPVKGLLGILSEFVGLRHNSLRVAGAFFA